MSLLKSAFGSGWMGRGDDKPSEIHTIRHGLRSVFLHHGLLLRAECSERHINPDHQFRSVGEGPMTKIAFTTIGDATSIKCWSGTPYHMAKALTSQGNEVVYVGPLEAPLLPLAKAYSKLREGIGLPTQSPLQMPFIASQYAADAASKVYDASPDVVFAPAGSAFAWNTPAHIPLVYTSDATFKLIDGYHPSYRNLSPAARRTSDELERRTIARADLLLYPTQWAADSAIKDYGADHAKVHVIPWGANLEETPDRDSILGPRKPGPCRLLFVGNNWKEKGADVAVETLGELQARGIEAELTIVGCSPPKLPMGKGKWKIFHHLDKNEPRQWAVLDQLYRDADFFILPTRADCYGIVFCEAAAYGVPSIAPDTGGVPGVVNSGWNGFLMASEATPSDYAYIIEGYFSNMQRLNQLKQLSRNAFETRLNWQVWGKRVSELIKSL